MYLQTQNICNNYVWNVSFLKEVCSAIRIMIKRIIPFDVGSVLPLTGTEVLHIVFFGVLEPKGVTS